MNSKLIRNIWAVGKNYAEHAKEMNSSIPSEPLFFLKSGSCIETGSAITLPSWSTDVQHEIEIALWLDENLNYSHISLALDLTARDAQNAAKAKGHPWTLSKSFTGSCPLGQWVDLREIGSIENLSFELSINNKITQKAFAHEMIYKPNILLEYAKKHFPICPYDVILTGTPSGVSALHTNDSLDAVLQNDTHKIVECHWDVV